jgi:hypothetical protein
MIESRVISAGWWKDEKIQSLDAESKLLLLWLCSVADRDGIAPCLTSKEHGVTVQFAKILALIDCGLVGTYKQGNKTWAWIPSVPEQQPSKGALRPTVDHSRPSPPVDVVISTIEKRTGKKVSKREAKQICPRAFGLKKSQSTGIPSNDVSEVWEAWRVRQAAPERCRLGAGSKRNIEKALREADKGALIDLIEYAYESEEAAPRFWRGENAHGRTYLGLDNLFVVSKLAGRLQSVEAWKKQTGHSRPKTKGLTDLGPLARYRT